MATRITSKDVMRYLAGLIYGDENWENVQPFDSIRVHSGRYADTVNVIRKYLGDKQNLRVLDFGTGRGFMSLLLKKFFPSYSILACDIQIKGEVKRLLEQNEIEVQENVVFGGGKSLPFDNSSFDVVLFLEVLEHVIDDPKNVVSELHRICNSEGTLFLTTPNIAHIFNRIRLLLGKQPQLFLTSLHQKEPRGHFREWTMKELICLLEDFFEIVEARYVNTVGRHGMISKKSGLRLLYYPYALLCTIKSSFRSEIAMVAKARKHAGTRVLAY